MIVYQVSCYCSLLASSLIGQISRSKMLAQGVHQFSGPKTQYIGCRQAGLILHSLHFVISLLFREMICHERYSDDFAVLFAMKPVHSILIDRNHAFERRKRAIIVSLDAGCAGLVTEDHSIWESAMKQPQSYGRIAGMVKRALPLDKNPIVPGGEMKNHLLDHTCNEVADDTIHRQPIARNHDSGLAGRNEFAA